MQLTRYCFSVILTLAFLASENSFAQPGMPDTEIYLFSINLKGGKLNEGKPENITHKNGYDNQPCFTPDNKQVYYVSFFDSIQSENKHHLNSEVHLYDIVSHKTKRITHTLEDEYSPTPIPSENFYSTVRVEMDSTQRLWRFPLDGGRPDLVLPETKRVGYHCWINNHQLGVWLLGDSLQIMERNGTILYSDTNVGRCIQKIPGKNAISFVSKLNKEHWSIWRYDLDSKKKKMIASCLEGGNEDYCWTNDGKLILGCLGKLYLVAPNGKDKRKEIADFTNTDLESFYRIAISPNNTLMALVTYKGKKP